MSAENKSSDRNNLMNISDADILKQNERLQAALLAENEAWTVSECKRILEKNSQWERDYTSLRAYEKCMDPYRENWRETIGEIKVESEFQPEMEPFFEDDISVGESVSINVLPDLKARAVLALPKNKTGPLPLVVALHGMLGSPSVVFGFKDPQEAAYHGYGRALLKKGFAVLAPVSINESTPRIRVHRLSMLLGSSITGLEIGKIRRLLDYASGLPDIDEERIGMWGISLGGLYTMCIAALDKRIKAAIMCAFFMDRFEKIAIESSHYSSWFLPHEEHLLIPGWFKGGFSDANLLSMVCPRALQIAEGKKDPTGWWRLQEKEFQKLYQHYDRLGLKENIEFLCHEGTHEVVIEPGLRFLERTLL